MRDDSFTRAQREYDLRDGISERLTHRKTLDAILDDLFDRDVDDAEFERHEKQMTLARPDRFDAA